MDHQKTSRFSYLAAAVVAISSLAVWAVTGAHTGWTQTKIPTRIVDEVTGIEATRFEDGFVAGVDFLAAAFLLAALLLAAGWVIRRLGRS